jgi:protein ImuB
MYACLHVPEMAEHRRGALLACAEAFSPRVEESGLGTLLLDAGGLEQLLGSPEDIGQAMAQKAWEAGMVANVGLSLLLDVAYLCAKAKPGVTVVAEGKEREELAALPVEVLEATPELKDILRKWGIRTVGALAELPAAGVRERLGAEGLLLQRRARAEQERVLTPLNPPPEFVAAMDLDDPLELLEPLSFLLSRLLNEICEGLARHSLSTNELQLECKLVSRAIYRRELKLPYAMREPKTFLKLLQLDLESNPPGEAITGVKLEAKAVDPRVVQHGLFLPLSPQPERLELTLARITGLVGENNAGTPELLDTHRPDGFEMRHFVVKPPGVSSGNGEAKRDHPVLGFRRYCPPLNANVQLDGGKPQRIQAPGLVGRVVSRSGPWRASGDWWNSKSWSRDEWDVALTDGGLYRIYYDWHRGHWYVEGSYD